MHARILRLTRVNASRCSRGGNPGCWFEPGRLRFTLAAAVLAATFGSACEDKKAESGPPKASAAVASAPAPAATEATPTRCTAKSQPQKLTVAMGSIYGLTTHGTEVFYTSWHVYGSRGAVNKVPKGGGPNTTLETMELEPKGLAVDKDSVFFTSGIRLMSLPLAGGSAELLAPSFSAQVIALHGGDVYGTPADYGPYDRVVKIAKKGGKETELATAPRPKSDERPIGYSSLAVDDSGIYVADSGGNRVLDFPLKGGKPKALASRQAGVFALVIDDTNVYYDLAHDGTLLSVPKAGGKPKKLAEGLVPSARLAHAGTDLFTTLKPESDGGPAKLTRIAAADGTAKSVTSIPPGDTVEAVTADTDCVYWAQHDSSGHTTLYAIARPK